VLRYQNVRRQLRAQIPALIDKPAFIRLVKQCRRSMLFVHALIPDLSHRTPKSGFQEQLHVRHPAGAIAL